MCAPANVRGGSIEYYLANVLNKALQTLDMRCAPADVSGASVEPEACLCALSAISGTG